MAKTRFLQNLKRARNLLLHRVALDHGTLDPAGVEAALARAAIWLNPSAVDGFDVRDFAELPPQLRNDLKGTVERFRAIAKQVSPTERATSDQLRDAASALLEASKIVEGYFGTGDEDRRIGEVLRHIEFPPAVRTWDYELGLDSTSDPAVWLYIFVDDQTAASDDFLGLTLEIEGKIRDGLGAAGITRWPYFRFRTESEQRELVG